MLCCTQFCWYCRLLFYRLRLLTSLTIDCIILWYYIVALSSFCKYSIVLLYLNILLSLPNVASLWFSLVYIYTAYIPHFIIFVAFTYRVSISLILFIICLMLILYLLAYSLHLLYTRYSFTYILCLLPSYMAITLHWSCQSCVATLLLKRESHSLYTKW